ncbi:MAG: hypothetical protein ACHQIK_20435, partial [Candidatus Acidiferrales bacterium]
MKFIGWIFAALLLVAGAPLSTRAQNRQSPHSQALANCMDEFSTCDQAALTVQEKQVVQSADRDRNFLECLYGFSDCDRKQLDTDQRQDIARANRDRNLQNCIDGMSECNLTMLDGQER